MNEKIKEAMAFAQKAHAAQMYDCYPYFRHLENTYNVLIKFGFKETNPEDLVILISAFLHDILEDTARSYSDLKKEFGEEIAEIVFCMTDELARNRREKKEKTYPKIRSNSKSIILKVADRIANLEHAAEHGNSSFIEMYRGEQGDFQYHLRVYRHIPEMWDHLNSILKFGNYAVDKTNTTGE